MKFETRAKHGMTLLELLLSLALSALLMVAIGMAIDLHLRALDSQRTGVEEAQLGRAVLRRMGDDLRGAVPQVVIDFSSVEQMAAGAALGQAANMLAGATGQNGDPAASGQTGTNQGTGGQGATGQGNSTQNGNSGGRNAGLVLGTNTPSQMSTNSNNFGSGTPMGGGTQAGGARGSTGLATSGRTASMQSGSRSVLQGTAGVGASGLTVDGAGGQTSGTSEDIAGSAGTVSIPGLYGNQYELQIDVSRLPRLDEYSGLANLSADGVTSAPQIPSDVKTVAYYLKTADNSLAGASTSLIREPQTGLVRRELDRAVTSFASANGAGDELVTAEKVLAPEVTSLEFQYFDGTAWTTSWDSDLQGGLPVAVEIVMGIASAKSRELQRRQAGGNPVAYAPAADDLLYRLVVKLPAGKIIEPPATEETTDPAAEAGTTGTTPTGGGTPSGAMGTGARGAGT